MWHVRRAKRQKRLARMDLITQLYGDATDGVQIEDTNCVGITDTTEPCRLAEIEKDTASTHTE